MADKITFIQQIAVCQRSYVDNLFVKYINDAYYVLHISIGVVSMTSGRYRENQMLQW